MWRTLTPDILAKFPHEPGNGSANGVYSALEPDTNRNWAKGLADLERYREYAEDDWDGQGAKGIPSELINGAVTLADLLRARGISPPDCVVPGFDGTVAFEWDLAGGGLLTLEITGAATGRLERSTKANPLELIWVAETVTA